MNEEERELDLQLADALDEVKELRHQLEIARGYIKTLSEEIIKLREKKPLAQPEQGKPWIGLTDEEIERGYEKTGHYQTLRLRDRFAVFALARAIEAKLKEKNT
jgi:hypothetical protein